ncbi:hypothetical protein IV417_17910 [Alphaproteobacteria bacterium KMM 3653]|uniref:Uncharacterized protein n=1 Tax=Harenicola maris TaxID=2841044 RepID=A0AAP2CXD9_9RHOB|nr:hypothetical protein [Harenicola maris]
MLASLFDTAGAVLRPILLVLVILFGIGLVSDTSGATGFGCQNATDAPKVNQMLCKVNPARIWNKPVVDLLPSK